MDANDVPGAPAPMGRPGGLYDEAAGGNSAWAAYIGVSVDGLAWEICGRGGRLAWAATGGLVMLGAWVVVASFFSAFAVMLSSSCWMSTPPLAISSYEDVWAVSVGRGWFDWGKEVSVMGSSLDVVVG